MIMNLYRNIDRTRLQFDFIIDHTENCTYREEIEALGGKIYILPAFNLKNLLIYRKAWREFFRQHPEYGIIHGHVRSTASIYLGIAQKFGLTTIAHSHSTSSGYGLQALIKSFLQYFIRFRAEYLLACSEASGEWLYGKRACKRDNFLIIKNAVDSSEFVFNSDRRKRIREELNLESKLVIGHVGRFIAAKNHRFLIDIFKAIHDKKENSMLLLVGDGELRNSAEERVKELGLLNSVIFTGLRSDIPDLLHAMDVFVFPSLYEGLPVTLIEAQASGLPCIISDSITSEVCITPIMRPVSLAKPSSSWADIVINAAGGDRQAMEHYLKNSGFDIEDSADKLSKFYEGIERNRKNEQIHFTSG